jgi:hypothetical protein
VPNALLLVRRDATSHSPLNDAFAAAGRALAWDDKFGCNPVVAHAPAAPDGDGYVLEVNHPDGDYETVSVGAAGDADFGVTALIYCEYRPEVAADGYERVGIFARDDGNANFDAGELGGGNCYALTYDTDSGRIRAGVVVAGVFSDFLAGSPLYEPSTAWREFSIACDGTNIRYRVDGAVVADVDDATHASGRMGIGHHEYFADDGHVHGTRAENFSALFADFDFDGDGDVDFSDFMIFSFCYRGPDDAYSPGHLCVNDDGDGDFDVDLRDFALFQTQFTGP